MGMQLLESPAAMDAFFGCDHLFIDGCSEGDGNGDAEIAAWYIAARACIAAEEALSLAASRADALPACVGAFAMHLALSKPFLTAASGSSHGPASRQYVAAAAASAYEVIKAAASNALASQPLNPSHLWAFGNDTLEKLVCSTGQDAKRLLLRAQECCRMGNSSASTGEDTQL
jgi:hypothetical protein